MHDAIAIGLPLVVIIAGILFNKQEVTSLRADMNGRFDRMDAKFDAKLDAVQRSIDSRLENIQRDMREFYAEQARHDVRIAALEQQK